MRSAYGWTIATAVFGVFLAGCGSGSSRLHERTGTWQEAHAVAERRLQSIETISGEGRINIETPEMAQGGSFALALRRPDSIFLRIEGPFGIKVGSALVTRDSMRFYSALENRLYIGSSNVSNLRRVLRFEITYDDLMNMISGGAFLRTDQTEPDSSFVEERMTGYCYGSPGGARRYFVDEDRNLRRIQFLNEQRRVVLDQSFSDHQTADGTIIPFTIRLLRPQERQLFSLRFSSLQVNQPALFPFRSPPNAEVIRWR